MTLLRISTLLALVFAAGCSSMPADHSAQAATPAPAPTKAAPVAAPLPDNALSAELLYGLLSAEVAAQRGDLALAASNYLRAAWDTRDPRVVKRAVRLALAAHSQAEALEATNLWVELEPANPEAHQVLAALLIRAGRGDEALPHFEALLTAAEIDSSRGYDAIVTLLSREQDKNLALSLFERLAKSHEADPNARFAHAQLAFMIGKQEVALADVEALLKVKPSWSKALVLKATIERHQGKIDAALMSFKSAVAAAPNDAGVRLSYARMLVDVQRYELARSEFEALQRQLPDNTDIGYALGLLALQLGDLDSAERHFRRLVEANQRTDESAYALGQIAENRGKLDEALRWYEAVGDGPNALDAKLRSATIIKNRDGLDAARSYLHSLRSDVPEEQSRLALTEAELLREAGKFPEAMAVLDAAIETGPESADLLYARAMVAERIERLDWLERDLRKILATEPNNAQALNALGYTLADRTPRLQEAYELIKRALEQHPDDPAINDSMGWVLFRLGRYTESEQYLKKAAGEMHDPEIAAHLGELYWVTGRKEEANGVWQKALKQAPESTLLKTVIQRLTTAGKPQPKETKQ